MIDEVERAAAAAWPASRTESVDGWLLRHTPGVPRRRSNSALPPPAERGPERALGAVEAFYRAVGLPVTVQVSPAERHVALDAALAARGYRREAPTLVLIAPAADVAGAAADVCPAVSDVAGAVSDVDGPAVSDVGPAVSDVDGPAASDVGGAAAGQGRDRPAPAVMIEGAATAKWLGAYRALNGPADTSAVAELVLARVPAPAAFARVAVDGVDVAIGLFVAGGERAGVFCMATDPRYRRRGLARAVLTAGARWALARGCAGLYLQVEQDNVAARDLYGRTGFAHSHSYHYRVADGPRGEHCSESTPAL
jgi:ribosomal protein S18 acetylase RimI-like enzyme